MSGIEIIGVVLGAIPLVISGFEHYADGVRTIKVICGASREFKALSRKLGAEEVLYRNTLELLLSDCLDLQKHNELTREPDGVAWEDLEVKAALQGRLQEAYDSFIEHVRSVAEALDEIKGRLQIGPSGKVHPLSYHIAELGRSLIVFRARSTMRSRSSKRTGGFTSHCRSQRTSSLSTALRMTIHI